MMPRENYLVPSDKEIYRRIAEELDFCKRLLLDIIENPNNYYLGEDHQDVYNMSDEFLEDVNTVIVSLTGQRETSPTVNSFVISSNAASRERVVGASGEAKTNSWRRLREKAESYIFGGGSISAKLSALAEYTEYGTTVMESVENIFLESPTGKSISEGIALLKQGFSAAARRLSE